MEAYRYKAMNADGRMAIGRVEAINPADLEVRLSRMGLDLVSFQELSQQRKAGGGQAVKTRDLITFCFHLEHLARSGVPILEGLADLRDTVDKRRLREVTTALIESIEGGKNLSEAMADFPKVFDRVFVSLIRAGEQSGRLAEVLENIIENLKWQDEQVSLTKRLLIYPVVVGLVVVAVLAFLMAYVVPELLTFVTAMGEELPIHTQVLIAVSNGFVSYWFVIFGVPVLLFLGGLVAVSTSEDARLRLDALKLKLPLVGPVLKKVVMARFAAYFSIMYGAGITILDCMRVSGDLVGNRAIAAGIADAGRDIADGKSISEAFAASGLFPRLVIRMLRVGENTGSLEDALHNVHYFYTRDVRESIGRIQELLPVIVTVAMGILVAWVMLSVLGPIYDIITQVDF